MDDETENGHQPIQGLENEESRYYRANKERRSFLHVRPVSYSCRTRDASSNHAREMASNIRAFLMDDPEFNTVFLETTDELVDADRRHSFEAIYIAMGKDITTFDRLPVPEQSHERASVALYILTLGAREREELLGLQLVVSCKLRGYEKELFVLKSWIAGLASYWIGRVCYHAIFPARYADPLDFDALQGKLEWIDALHWCDHRT